MIGAIAGDIIGSQFEWLEFKKKKFNLFTGACSYTDDSLMTLAIGEAFVLYKGDYLSDDFKEYVTGRMVKMGREHQGATWGKRFYDWFMKGPYQLDSWGNGAAMRVSSVGWVAKNEDEVKRLSYSVTSPSHDHPESYRGAEAVAMAIYLGREGAPMSVIRKRMIEYYPEIENMSVDGIRPNYGLDPRGLFMSCQGSVPQAIVCFLESVGYEDAVRNAISLGGDSDTQACITGSIAEAYYGVPIEIEERALEYLTDKLRTMYYAFGVVRQPRKKRITDANG